ncbi:hypothetical protein [Ramlibacter alkalitolerans]|uniref:Uncharacterized protein n=1 Tax=Ramlibacter alkalitolerans TaxID=2039631 RepID=A0ABS1JRH1_9BURK|nr:hypothetical protein [Ramlibacter alkalitolerans]MBL0426818.1 hypothetical protein [Ramlibacter alkalitolerans]
MEFLSNLQTDVKLLLVAGALALMAALLSATKRNEHRYMALFSIVMLGAAYRFYAHEREDEALARAQQRAEARAQAGAQPTARTAAVRTKAH